MPSRRAEAPSPRIYPSDSVTHVVLGYVALQGPRSMEDLRNLALTNHCTKPEAEGYLGAGGHSDSDVGIDLE